MKAVLDTNVLVSAFLSPHGPCARVVDLLVEGSFEICVDDRILDEYEEVLFRPEPALDPGDVRAVMELIRAVCETVAALPLDARLPDPDGMCFLEVATAAGAILVAGNVKHFPKSACGDVFAASPSEFLGRLEPDRKMTRAEARRRGG